MGFFQSIVQQLPLYLLSLPVILIALSVHESAHGYMAYKLGDPTARNLGRITLNPVKHFDLFGFLCMLIVHFGWAKPVPINARYFKNPRRDMALTGAAGPISNILLALVSLLVLRVSMIFISDAYMDEALEFAVAFNTGTGFQGSLGFTIIALIVYLLSLGVTMNIVLAIFNLIPIPPFDGSRIFYVFLPPKWYFGIMKYERYIMLGFFVLLAFGFLQEPLSAVEDWVLNGLYTITGMGIDTEERAMTRLLEVYVYRLLGLV